MNIPVKIGFKCDETIFYCKAKIRSKNASLRNLKIRSNSYIGNVFSRVYDALFSGGIKVIREYRRYYSREFDNYEAFLIGKYSVAEEEISRFNPRSLYCNANDYYDAEQLLEDEAIQNSFWKAVIIEHEN